MFQPNTERIQQFRKDARQHGTPLIDFGIAPVDNEDREDWSEEVQRLLLRLHLQGYTLTPIAPGPCSVYRVSEESEGRDDDLATLAGVVKQLLLPVQRVVVCDALLEIHVLDEAL